MSRPLLLAALTAFLLMLGLGVLFPVLPYFTRHLGLSDVEAGLLMGGYPAVSVLMSPLWGRFSERRGRKPALIVGLLGFAASFGLFGLGSSFAELLGARLLGGFFSAAALPAIFAYVADITPAERRSTAMGVVGAAIGLGISFGPLVGGVLGSVDLRLPYFASAGLGLATAAAVAALLPESLTPARQRAAATRRDRLQAQGLSTFALARRLLPFLLYSFLTGSARLGVDTTLGFLVADRLDGALRSVGLLLFAMGLVGATVQGGVLRPLSRRFDDVALLRAGTLLMAAGLLGVATAQTWLALGAAGLALAAGYALLTPTFTALLSRAAEDVQGEAQGLNNSAQSLSRVVGPIAFTALYQYVGTASPYLLAALLCALALLAARGRLGDPRGAVLAAPGDAPRAAG